MKKNILIVPLIMLLLLFFIGCESPQSNTPNQITQTINFYYGDSNNETMVTEEREIVYEREDDKYVEALEALVKGPDTSDYNANINPDTVVYGTIKQNRDLIVDFSQDFAQFGGSVAEIIGVGSVVNTMTQFEEIDRVKILVEGNELIGPSGEPYGFFEPFPTDPKITEVTLYFSNQQATEVVGEKRELTGTLNQEQFIISVLEELIKGPENQDLYATIPETVKIQDLMLEDNLVEIDFSQEMYTDHWGGAAGEAMTINSIADTLFEFPYIDKIKMTVTGEPMNIEHMVLDEPITRD
ncbi:MAG: hypothetical protein APF76_15430 [Desulfitibacter sp. BRH_c19]|nr:MAG: hypothetical protein APF76_15430 [Desulfitibacter sp. BRH_c19]